MQPLLHGVAAIFIPIKDPQLSAKWYEEKLGFKLLYIEEDAASGHENGGTICYGRMLSINGKSSTNTFSR